MADISKEIVSFEVDADLASQQVDNYVNKLELLEKEQQRLQKSGKDTAQVQAQISAITQKLNKVLTEEVSTQKALRLQTEAQTKAARALANTQKDVVVTTEKVNNSNVRLASSFARAGGQVKNLGGFLGLAVGGLANFTGGLELGGFALSAITNIANKAFTALDNYLFPVNRATELSRELATAYIDESANLAKLSTIITDTTTSTDDRARAINALNEQYGDYLPNLLTEKSSNEEVAAAIRSANSAIIDGIIVRAKSEEASKQLQIILQENIRLQQLDTDASLKRNKFLAQGATTLLATASLGVFGGYLANTEAVSGATADAIEAATRASIQGTIDAATQNLNNLDKTFEAVRENLSGIKLESLAAASDITKSGLKQAEIAEKNADKTTKARDKERKATEAAKGSLAALEKQLQDIAKLINETPLTDKQLVTLGKSYQTLQKDVEKARQRVAELKGEIEEQKFTEIDASRIGKINRVETNALIEQEKELKQLISEIDAENTSETAQQRQNALDRLQLEINLLNTQRQKLEVEKQSTAEIDKQLASLIKEEAQLGALLPLQNQQENQQRQITALEIEQIKAQSDPQRLAIEKQILQLKLAELETQRQILAIQGQNTLEVDKQIAQLQAQAQQLDTDAVKQRTENLKSNVSELLGFVGDIVTQTGNLLAVAVQSQIAQIDNAISRTQSNLDGLLQSQENVSAQQIQIEQERLDKLQAQREKAAEKEAIIAKAQIAAQTAVTIARAAAEGGGIGSAITIAAAIASLVFGFAQAQIAAQNSFYDGTLYVQRGNNPKGRDTIPAMLNEGEAVIPTQTNKEYSDVISAIYNKSIPAGELNKIVRNWKSGQVEQAQIARAQIMVVGSHNSDTHLLEEIAKNTAFVPTTEVKLTAGAIVKTVTNRTTKHAKAQNRNR